MLRLRFALVLALAVCLACGGDTSTPTGPAPTPTRRFLTVNLTPSEGQLLWEPVAGQRVKLTPTLAWKAQFLATETSWNFIVVVRLFDPDGRVCLESYTPLGVQAREGLAYTVVGESFSRPWAPSCGNSFAVTDVEVAVKSGSTNGNSLLQARLPCLYQFSLAGTP